MEKERIAIVSAIDIEIAGVSELLENSQTIIIGRRSFSLGQINNKDVVLVCSMWGKVATAITITTLIRKFNISKIVFIGLAGALKEFLNVGDIIISKKLYQHDIDARPALKRYQLPILNTQTIEADAELIEQANALVKRNLSELSCWKHAPKCYIADIATGDQLILTVEGRKRLSTELPSAYCVEMEGAALAQVCAEEKIPFLVIRGISDDFNDSKSFIPFAKKCWRENAKKIIAMLIAEI